MSSGFLAVFFVAKNMQEAYSCFAEFKAVTHLQEKNIVSLVNLLACRHLHVSSFSIIQFCSFCLEL